MNIISDLESSSLLYEEIAKNKSTTLSKALRASLAVGTILILATTAFFSYLKNASISSNSNLSSLSVFSTHTGIDLCENTYVFGVTPRTPSDGCVILAQDDLLATNAEKLYSPTKTICINAGTFSKGTLEVGYDLLKELGFIDTDGSSTLSGIIPGHGISVTVFSEKNFKGESELISTPKTGQLPTRHYNSGKTVNTAVFSLVIESQYFSEIPKSCGATTQVCTNLVKNSDLANKIADGCIAFTTTDPYHKGRENSYNRATRFCASKAAGRVTVLKQSMINSHLAHLNGNHRSQVSFIKKGRGVDYLVYYSSDNAEGQNQVFDGELEKFTYDDGSKANDNLNSFIYSSTTFDVPITCDF